MAPLSKLQIMLYLHVSYIIYQEEHEVCRFWMTQLNVGLTPPLPASNLDSAAARDDKRIDPRLPSGRHFLLFPSTRWESLSTLLLLSGITLSPSASQSFLNASFYVVYSSFWIIVPFSLPARPVSALDGLHSIKFCSFLTPLRMGLTNPGRALGRSSLLLISRKFSTLSGILPFSTNLFRLAFLLILLVGLNLSFLIGALA